MKRSKRVSQLNVRLSPTLPLRHKLKDQLLFKQPDVSIYQKHTKLALHPTPPIPEDINNEQKKIHSKANKKSIDELETQLIELNIEFFTALKYLKQSIYTVSPQDQKYIETLENKIQITTAILQRTKEHKQRHQNSPQVNA